MFERSKGLDVDMAVLADFIERHEVPLSSCALQVYIIGHLFAPGSSPFARGVSVAPLPRLVTPQPAMTLVYPIALDVGGGKTCVAVSPDGSAVAAGSKDQITYVWNTTDHTHRVLRGHTDSVCAIAFSPDGRQLASGSKDATVRVWDPATHTEVEQREEHRSADLSTQKPVASQRARSRILQAVTKWCRHVSTGSERLVGLGLRCTGRSNPATDTDIGQRQEHCLASKDITVRVRDTATGTEIGQRQGHRHAVLAVAFTRDETRILSGSLDQDVIVWVGSRMFRLQDHSGPVTAVAVSSDGLMFATCSTDKTIHLRSADTSRIIHLLREHQDEVYCIAFSPDSSKLLSGGRAGIIYLWDVRMSRSCGIFTGHTQAINSLSWIPHSSYFLSASEDGTIRRWDATTGESVAVVRGPSHFITDIDVFPDGERYVASSCNGRVYILSRGVRTLADQRKSGVDAIKLLACSADGVLIAACDPYAVLHIWDIRTGEAVVTFEGAGSYPMSLEFSPDSSRIIMTYGDDSQDTWIVGYDFPRPASPPASAMEVAVTFSGDSDGWLYFTRPSDTVLTRYCWVPHDRRWSDWSAQVAWANGVLAIGTDGGVITILDFTSVWSSQS
jgi:WD40 repeat protein